jgi:O-antigen/teichoic acid export membrane protein
MSIRSNTIFKNFLSLSGAEVISRFSVIIVSVFVARIFTVDDYGIIGFITALLTYFSLIVNFGYDVYGTRETAKNISGTNDLLNLILSVKLISSIVSFFLYFIFIILFIPHENQLLALLFGLILITDSLNLNWFYRGTENMQVILSGRLIENILYLLLFIVLINLIKSLYVMPAALFTAQVTGIIFYYKKLPEQIILRFVLSSRKYFSLIRSTFVLGFTSLFALIYLNLDLVMIKFIKSDYDAGLYNAAAKIFILGTVPLHLILAVFFPPLSKLFMTKNLKNIFKQYALSLILTSFLIAVLFYFLADHIVSIIFGTQYKTAVEPLKILSVCIFIVGLSITFGNPLVAWGKQNYHMIAIFAGGAINIILNLILIPRYSFIGAAYATLIAEGVVFLIVLIFFMKVYKSDLKLTWN